MYRIIDKWNKDGIYWYNFTPYLRLYGWKPKTPEEYHSMREKYNKFIYKKYCDNEFKSSINWAEYFRKEFL